MQTLTLRCTLKPTLEQAAALEATVRLFAEACNHALRVARERGEFRRFKLHRLVYRDLRSMGLSANLAVQAIARVGRKKGNRAKFYQPTSCTFDQRTLSLRGESVSLTTTAGRLIVPMKLGDYQRGMLAKARGVQGGVLTRGPKGKWYINLSIRVEVPTPPTGGKVVGLDMGQRYMATLSSGIQVSGGGVKSRRIHLRNKRAEVRSRLDTERTKGLSALWERLCGRERRFVDHTLHTLAKRIVDSLEPGDTLAIEDLTGLRSRTAQRGKEARYLHNLWPYARFRSLLEYKAALRGVRVVAVDPRHTSQECPRCGHTARENRRSQALFRCTGCGFQHNADWVAATNIARRAGSTGMGRCKPARILRVSSPHRLSSESPRL
ncbi:RNA-guided endonuclease InsQ/TnpB family protein [Thermus albus]|uniref:RNA-guided endonuclease InsQ/TnpB family protein n=1 Tax=Thermus albus TaxID=2908146 RepID=UPI001FAAB2C9|nr:transposase [Thermus albus]